MYYLSKNNQNKDRNFVKMHTTPIRLQNQNINPDKFEIFRDYFSMLKVGSMLNKSGIIKTKAASPLKLFSIVFNLAFIGKNFFEGVVRNKKSRCRQGCRVWFFKFIHLLQLETFHNSGLALMLAKNWTSKKMKLLSRVFDHTTKKYLKGFRMLTLGWSDGNSFLGINFALLSSAKEKHRYNEINPDIDKRTCGYQRCKETITKSIILLEPMIKKAINIGILSKYLVMDSWFSMPSVISTLRQHIHIIYMLKDNSKWALWVQWKKLRLRDLYSKLKEKRGKAKIKASVLITLPDGNKAKIIFIPCDKKRGWFALLSTDISIANEEIRRLCSKRWDLEVFFKMCKQHLKLVKEIQIRNYDGLIGHIYFVMARYNILSPFQSKRVEQRSFGDLFRACYEKLVNITFIDTWRG